MTKKPRILLFTGDGKGKTTAAMGIVLRAAGHDMPTLVLQFVKQDATTGELAAAERLKTVDFEQTGLGFLPPDGDPRMDPHREAAEAGLARASEAILTGQYSLVVLDEICFAVDRGLLSEADVLALLEQAPPHVNIVMTGRGATAGLIEAADTVSEIRCLKQASQQGRGAQTGIEL
jgi:cob(I)alamin adenosyltransferase